MRIHRWKKPELSITLTSGGSLQANTTYWIFGYFHSRLGGYDTYYGGHSPHGVPITFTTDSTNLSISVDWFTSGNIASYSDNGDGTINVSSELHCLTDDDEITIESGTYAGTYTITWVDYDTFQITATYSVDETSTWKCEVIPNDASSLKLWMSDFNPTNADGTYSAPASFEPLSHSPYVDGYTAQNIAITSEFSNNRRPDSMPFLVGLDKSFLFLFETGIPAIIGDETSFDHEDLQEAFEDSQLYPYCRASQYSWEFHGFMEFPNLASSFQYLSIYVRYGSIWNSKMYLRNGASLFGTPVGRNYAEYIARDSNISAPRGTPFDRFPIDYDSDTVNAKQINQNVQLGTSTLTNYNLVNARTFTISYPSTGEFTNSKLQNTYVYYVYRGVIDDSRHMKNIECIKANNVTYDFLIYNYDSTEHSDNFENIDTDREKNLKVLQTNYRPSATQGQVDITFWRKGTIYLNDDIDGATCSIKAGDDTYEFTSANGEIEFDVVEQRSLPDYQTPNDTIVEDFEVTISKEGYETYVVNIPIAIDLVDMIVELKTEVPLMLAPNDAFTKLNPENIGEGRELLG